MSHGFDLAQYVVDDITEINAQSEIFIKERREAAPGTSHFAKNASGELRTVENEDWASGMMRFANGSTTDDHGMHLVGYLEKDGKDWYLVKDSGAGSRNCGKESENFGFYFMHEDYVKLKMMGILVHKDVAAELLKRFKG